METQILTIGIGTILLIFLYDINIAYKNPKGVNANNTIADISMTIILGIIFSFYIGNCLFL